MNILNLFTEDIIKVICVHNGKFCQTIQVQGDDLCGTCHDTTCTKCITEGIVCKLVAKATTRRKGIHGIRHVDKETMSFTHLLCAELHELWVNKATLTIRQDTCGKHGVRQKLFVSLLAEPLHEELLKLHEAVHVRLSTIWIVEVTKHLLHVRAVKDRDVPEDALVSTGRSGLIQSVDNTLKLLLDFLCVSLQVIFAILLACKIVKIVQEFNRCYGTCKVRRYLIHKVDKGTTEGLKVLRCFRDTTHALRTFEQERVQGDRSTIWLEGCLIMCVDEVVVKVFQIVLCVHPIKHTSQLFRHQLTVECDGIRLVYLCLQGCQCLTSDIGIGIYFGATGSIACLCINTDEVKAILHLMIR